MSAPRVLSGARAKVGVVDPNTGLTTIIGIYSQASYEVVYDTQAAYILGSYIPQEIDYVAVEPVVLQCSGWKTTRHGWYTDGKLPRVQDLLLHEYLTMAIYDRQAEALGQDSQIGVIHNIRPTRATVGYASKALSEIGLTFTGILSDSPDEGVVNAEHPTAARLP